jgi:hypothetical protein
MSPHAVELRAAAQSGDQDARKCLIWFERGRAHRVRGEQPFNRLVELRAGRKAYEAYMAGYAETPPSPPR